METALRALIKLAMNAQYTDEEIHHLLVKIALEIRNRKFHLMLAFCLLSALAHAAIAPDAPKLETCRVTTPTSKSDWMTREDAVKAAQAWALLGIEADVYCRPHIDRMEWAELGGDTGIRMLDAYSTPRALAQHGTHESVLPDFISHHTVAMYTYSAAVVAFNWALATELRTHHHTRLAKLVYAVDIGIEAPAVGGNFNVALKKARKDALNAPLQ